MIKYKAGRWSKELIEAVEITKETEYNVWFKQDRHQKRSSGTNFFDTWKEAHEYLIQKAQEQLDMYRKGAARAAIVLQDTQAYKEADNVQTN